jgi:hypothetical protein
MLTFSLHNVPKPINPGHGYGGVVKLDGKNILGMLLFFIISFSNVLALTPRRRKWFFSAYEAAFQHQHGAAAAAGGGEGRRCEGELLSSVRLQGTFRSLSRSCFVALSTLRRVAHC